ncbi:MAG TPA: cytochrome P460 family protein [Acidobacteriaceae bacterium]|nr:cytochrome P460 family protein [Acidobacteriaceae bacterium]
MRPIAFVLLATASIAGIATHKPNPPQQANAQANPAYVTQMPAGYRDYRFINVAHEAGGLNSLGAMLGNDIAIKAYRSKTLPFPNGTIIAALHYTHSPNAENNQIFGQAQSFTPGSPTNIQFIKDSHKYAATGGWGFGTFKDGKPDPPAAMKSCFPCHAREKARDMVFTQYAP